jgi:hypothetical protein
VRSQSEKLNSQLGNPLSFVSNWEGAVKEFSTSQLKIIVSWVQMLNSFLVTFPGIPWPLGFKRQLDALTALASAFAIDVWGISSISEFFAGWDCVLGISFESSFWFTMLLLPGLAGLICVAAILSTLHVRFGLLKKLHFGRVGFETIRVRGVNVFITAVFLLYPTICSKVFRVFNPHTIGDRTYLRDDLSLEFLVDERHKPLYVFAAISVRST